MSTLTDLSVADDPLLVLKAKAALLSYPAMTRELRPIYGSSSEFQEILREYGGSVLPAIHYFVSNPAGSIEWKRNAGKQYESIKSWFFSSGLRQLETRYKMDE